MRAGQVQMFLNRGKPGQVTLRYACLDRGKVACSKRSDSGERCEVKKAIKSRGGLFTSHRSPLSERLEQAWGKGFTLTALTVTGDQQPQLSYPPFAVHDHTYVQYQIIRVKLANVTCLSCWSAGFLPFFGRRHLFSVRPVGVSARRLETRVAWISCNANSVTCLSMCLQSSRQC